MTQTLQCSEVQSKRDQRDFVELEKRLYKDDPNWVPPLWYDFCERVGFKKHPFYDDATAQAFVVRRDNEVVGRVLAIVNHAHNRRYDEKRGFFGFYQCDDDVQASNLLLDSACKWLKKQGMTDVRGPANPSLNYEVGLLVEGFDTPPTFLISYNHEYYGGLIEAFGFEKVQDLYCYDAAIHQLDNLDPKMVFVIEEATKRFRVTCRPLDRKNFKRDVLTFLDIYNQSLQQTWGYVPMSEAEMKHQATGLKHLIVPELTSIAEIDGRAVGSGFGLLDYNPIIKKINGKLLPFGWFKLLTGKKHLKRLRLISTNVLPEYQKWGLGLVVLARMMPSAIEYGIEVGEFSWILESNSLSWGTVARGGAIRTKVQRIYDRSLSDIA